METTGQMGRIQVNNTTQDRCVEYRLMIPQDRWVEYRLIIPQDRWVEYRLIIPQDRWWNTG